MIFSEGIDLEIIYSNCNFPYSFSFQVDKYL